MAHDNGSVCKENPQERFANISNSTPPPASPPVFFWFFLFSWMGSFRTGNSVSLVFVKGPFAPCFAC